METPIEILNIELFKLKEDYRVLISKQRKKPTLLNENSISKVIKEIEEIQSAVNKLMRI